MGKSTKTALLLLSTAGMIAAAAPAFSADPAKATPRYLAFTRGVDTNLDGIFLGGSTEEDGTDIYIKDIANPGTTPVRVNAANSVGDITPSFSPDGTKLAWASEAGAGGKFDILVKNLTNGTVVNLTNTSAVNERWPNWSADGTKIVYNRQTPGASLDVWMMSATGANQRYVAGGTAEDCCASFNPYGNYVVFGSARSGNFDLYRYEIYPIVNPEDPTRLKQLTSNSWYEGTPSYEPSGTVLYRSGQNQQAYRLDPNAANPVGTLLPTGGEIRTPVSTPDGSKLLMGYRADATKQLDIIMTNPNGSGKTFLTSTAGISETDPTIQP